MTDLLSHPFYRAEHLGRPLPDTPFGVSVCLPLWSHVIGYEEKDPEVVKHFKSGYPRFCCPPAVGALFEAAEKEFATPNERCLVFPRVSHAERCLNYIVRTGGSHGRVVHWLPHDLGVAVFSGADYDKGRKFWRFCGEMVSTRQACEALGISRCGATEDDGRHASQTIRQRLAALSGQEPDDVFLFPSGMAANYAVHRMLTHLLPARKTVQLDFPYVDVLKLQQAFGSGAHFLPMLDASGYEDFRELLSAQPVAGVFCEAPSNPLLRCVDFSRVRELMSELCPDAPLIIDDTIATVAHADVLRFADIATASLTKAFSGKGDVMAGSVILSRQSPLHSLFSDYLLHQADHELWCGDAVALEENSRDFTTRADRFAANASALAEFLRTHPRVAKVWHASTDGGPGYESIRRPNGGYGCLVSFVLKDASTGSPAVFDALEVSKGPSLGSNFTLACPYTLLAHYDELDWAESCGVPRELIRVSAGLEDEADLIARFERALAVR